MTAQYVEPEFVAGVDVDRRLLVERSTVTSSQLLRIRRESTQPTASRSSYASPTDGFFQFVTELLGGHVRRTGGTGADLADAPFVFSHLVEMVVRTALRQNWDLHDAAEATRRIHQMMFLPNSLLVHVASYSALEFVDDRGSYEKLMLISDVPRRLSSQPSVPPVDGRSDSLDISNRRPCK